MKKIKFLLLLLFPLVASAQTFDAFISSLYTTPAANRQARVDSFMQANTQFPIFSNSTTVNFVLTTDAKAVHLAGDMNNWNGTQNAMTNVDYTNFWFKTFSYFDDARLEYKYVLDYSNWILDPRNPNKSAGGYGDNSELAMPNYVQPWEVEERAGVPKGNYQTYTLNSTYTGTTYSIVV